METETVTVIRPPADDPFGDPGAGTPTEVDIPGCLFAPGSSTENNDAGQAVTTDGAVYAPAGVDVRPTDLMRVRGRVYGVVGDPQDWGSSGVVIALRKYTG